MDHVCPYCNGYNTSSGFVHDVNCPRFVQPDIYSPPAENLREKIVRMTQEIEALKAENEQLDEALADAESLLSEAINGASQVDAELKAARELEKENAGLKAARENLVWYIEQQEIEIKKLREEDARMWAGLEKIIAEWPRGVWFNVDQVMLAIEEILEGKEREE